MTDKVNEITNDARSSSFVCRACGIEFEKPSSLYWHRRKEHSTVRHQCSICKKPFLQAGGLDTHMRIQHAGQRAFECPVCSRAFAQSTQLYQHYRQHEAKEEAPSVDCQLCGKAFANADLLRDHNSKQHKVIQQQKQFPCETCGRTYMSLAGVKRHQRRHNNNNGASNKNNTNSSSNNTSTVVTVNSSSSNNNNNEDVVVLNHNHQTSELNVIDQTVVVNTETVNSTVAPSSTDVDV